MNSALNIIQETNSILDVSFSHYGNPVAAHLLAYIKKLKIQKIFQIP